MAKLSKRRQHLLNRLGAIIKNLEKLPDDFTLDKKMDRVLDKLEAGYRRHAQVQAYRGEHRKILEQKKAEEIQRLEEEAATRPDPKPVLAPFEDGYVEPEKDGEVI